MASHYGAIVIKVLTKVVLASGRSGNKDENNIAINIYVFCRVSKLN